MLPGFWTQLDGLARTQWYQRMPLEFDPNQTYDDNLARFRKHLESVDPECAAILFNNLDTLLGDGDPNRVRQNRTAFNVKVLRALAALAPKKHGS
jgi:hypothetical protein